MAGRSRQTSFTFKMNERFIFFCIHWNTHTYMRVVLISSLVVSGVNQAVLLCGKRVKRTDLEILFGRFILRSISGPGFH